MAGTLAGKVKVVFAGTLLDGFLELDDSPTFGTATADEPAGITTTSTAVREDDCDEAFLEETFALPVIVVPGGNPVVLTRMFNVSEAPPGRVPTLQVAASGPDEVHVLPVSAMPARS
jgi:hypothetical protein